MRRSGVRISSQAPGQRVFPESVVPYRHPGDRTAGLLLSALDGRYESQREDGAEAGRIRAVTTLFMVADIAAAVTVLAANGIDVRDQLVSPYLMPDGL
jgi:hypothetical protein